jgi:hypothetical protein
MTQLSAPWLPDIQAERWEAEIRKDAWCSEMGCTLDCPLEVVPLSRDCRLADGGEE